MSVETSATYVPHVDQSLTIQHSNDTGRVLTRHREAQAGDQQTFVLGGKICEGCGATRVDRSNFRSLFVLRVG